MDLPPKRNKLFTKKRLQIIAGVGIVALAVAGYMLLHLGEESTDDATIEAHVVTLSPKVGGYVKTLNISDNQSVKAGDMLLEIDPADYLIRRDHASAALDAARAQVSAAEANWDKAANDLKRMQRLSDQARSHEQLDDAVAAEKTASSNLQDAKARLRSNEADLAQAEDDLANTKIFAPMGGRITRRSVEMGDYIQTGQQLGYIVGNDFWVVANFKETQLKNMRSGQAVSLRIDAYPSASLQGKIDSVQSGTGTRFSSFPPENATGNYVKIVQRVPVKILFTTAPDLPLGPGMSVVPTVYTR